MKLILKKEKGITLIALVVTIIVLIILVGVSINLVLGDKGIITIAKRAKENIELTQIEEEKELNELYLKLETAKYIEDIESGNGGSSIPDSTLTTKDLTAGVYIKYDTGVSSVGTNGVVTCRVLYDASSQYGLQIITDKNIADVTLGGSDWATGSVSYNNAITTLNNEAGKYLNKTYVTDARCVGSVPTNKNGTFTNKNSENAGPVQLQFTSSISGANNMKETDTNYETDQTQMKNLNIWTTGELYWMASRRVWSDSSSCNFYVLIVNSGGYLISNYLCYVNRSGNTNGYSRTYGLRPCFSLKSDIKITGGNGTSDSPYTM